MICKSCGCHLHFLYFLDISTNILPVYALPVSAAVPLIWVSRVPWQSRGQTTSWCASNTV